ncbi:MAG: hypothetical protein J6V23_06900 [Bacteroidaceae bacterium]|nr:hypothetical protein [Bacteroidaceae bacterium]
MIKVSYRTPKAERRDNMDANLFEYEMKKAGYKTPEQRANVMGISLSAYYRRLNNKCECSKAEISNVADIVGWDVVRAIFFN